MLCQFWCRTTPIQLPNSQAWLPLNPWRRSWAVMGAAPFAAHAPSEPGPAAARYGRRLRLSSLRCRRHALQVAAQQQRQVPSTGNSGGGGVGSSGDAAAAAPTGSQAAPLSCSRRALGAVLGAAAVGSCCSTAAASESSAARPLRTLREYRVHAVLRQIASLYPPRRVLRHRPHPS